MTSPRRPTPTNTDTDTGTGTGTNDTDIGRQVPVVYVCYLDLALMIGEETRKEEGGGTVTSLPFICHSASAAT